MQLYVRCSFLVGFAALLYEQMWIRFDSQILQEALSEEGMDYKSFPFPVANDVQGHAAQLQALLNSDTQVDESALKLKYPSRTTATELMSRWVVGSND